MQVTPRWLINNRSSFPIYLYSRRMWKIKKLYTCIKSDVLIVTAGNIEYKIQADYPLP